MKIITTLSALLFTACTIPGLQTGSTLSASTSSSPAPAATPTATPTAAPAPAVATAPEAAAAPAPAPAPAVTTDDVKPIDDAVQWLDNIHDGSLVPGHGVRESHVRDRAMFCSQQVENLIAHEVPKSAELPLKKAHATLGEAEANICQALATAADGWDARGKQANAEQHDAVLEPYRKAGISGDKLKLVSDLGKQLIGPRQADATPDVVARANALFSLRHDGFREWTIVRYAFKGNEQTAVTEKGYADRPGADQYR